MTREQQQAKDPRYADWRAAYIEEVRERVKHWGDRRAGRRAPSTSSVKVSGLDGVLFAPGGQDA